MITVLNGHSADDVWRKAVALFRTPGTWKMREGRLGTTREQLRVYFSIDSPRQRWVTSRSPAINPAFAISEVVWIINGREDSAFLNYWNRQLPKFAGHGEKYHGAYGHRLRRQFGIDQLERAYEALRANPESRQVLLQIWNPIQDMPDSRGRPAAADIPCNICSLLKIRDGRLEWLQVMRSNDLFLGVPHNFIQFTFLQEIMAGWLGLELGSFDQISDSLHIYRNDETHILEERQIHSSPNPDSIAMPKGESEELFGQLAQKVDYLIRAGVSRDDLARVADWTDAPVSFINLLLVLAAESARRRKWVDLAEELMDRNKNPLYCQLWERWVDRISKKST